MTLLETVVRDRCGVHAARLLRIIMQVCKGDALLFFLRGVLGVSCCWFFFYYCGFLFAIETALNPLRKKKWKHEVFGTMDSSALRPSAAPRCACPCPAPFHPMLSGVAVGFAGEIKPFAPCFSRYSMLRAGYVQCLEVSKGAEVTNSKK